MQDFKSVAWLIHTSIGKNRKTSNQHLALASIFIMFMLVKFCHEPVWLVELIENRIQKKREIYNFKK